MRLLFVSHSLPPLNRPLDNVGGMQRVATELFEALEAHSEVRLDALILRSPWKGIHRRTVPFLAKTYAAIRKRVLAGDVDIVLFSSMVTASLAVPLRRLLDRQGVRAAAIVHGLDVTTPFAPYQRFVPRVFGALDLVMPVSQATGQACLARGLEPVKLRPVRNGVDVSRFSEPETSLSERRKALGTAFPEGARLLCSVGRQVPRKGFEWFIRNVMPRLPDSVHYWLAGSGPEHERIAEAATELGLGGRVRLLGRVSEDELESLYRGADLFVMPNIPVPGDMEGFGVVMLEAGLCGLPTVGAGIEGIAEVITSGENGQLVPSGDSDAFVRAISDHLSDPAAMARRAARANDYTRSNFSWQAVAGEYVNVMQERLVAG